MMQVNFEEITERSVRYHRLIKQQKALRIAVDEHHQYLPPIVNAGGARSMPELGANTSNAAVEDNNDNSGAGADEEEEEDEEEDGGEAQTASDVDEAQTASDDEDEYVPADVVTQTKPVTPPSRKRPRTDGAPSTSKKKDIRRESVIHDDASVRLLSICSKQDTNWFDAGAITFVGDNKDQKSNCFKKLVKDKLLESKGEKLDKRYRMTTYGALVAAGMHK